MLKSTVLSTLLLAATLVSPARADSINQTPTFDGYVQSHFNNVTYSRSTSMHVGAFAGNRTDVMEDGSPWDRCCLPPTPGGWGWGEEEGTYRPLLFWNFGPTGLDLTGHTVTDDATLTLFIREYYVDQQAEVDVYAIPPQYSAWRKFEDTNGNLQQLNGAVIYNSGAFGPNDCLDPQGQQFECREGPTWNNFGRDPSRNPNNDPNVDPNEGNSCDGIGTDLCDGHQIMEMIIADQANLLDTVDLKVQLGDAVAAIKGVPYEEVLPPNQPIAWHDFRASPSITITVPKDTVQSWIDSPDDNGGLLLNMNNDRALVTVAGDANNDGQTTGADLIAVQQNFGKAEEIPRAMRPGDANDDGQVTGLDLIFVQQNFGNTEETVPLIGRRPDIGLEGALGIGVNMLEPWTVDTLPFQSRVWPRLAFETTPPGAPVPEPGAMGMMGLAGMLISRRLRKSNR